MNKKLTIFSLLVFAIAGSLLAQTPTRPEHVAIGDIYCSNDDIVTPDAYGSRTDGIGVVFYVDSTMQRGWVAYYKQEDSLKWYTRSLLLNLPELKPYSVVRDGSGNVDNSEMLIKDVNGKSNTDVISKSSQWTQMQLKEFFPACYYAMHPDDYDPETPDVSPWDEIWYLPSAGQLNFMFAYAPVLNDSFELIGGDLFAEYKKPAGGYWTSNISPSTEGLAWYLCVFPPTGSNDKFVGGFYTARFDNNLMRVRAVRDFGPIETE